MPRKYTAEIFGQSWSKGPSAEFDTITEAREFAESYGTTADTCVISDHSGRIVARHIRDVSGDGTQWYKSTID